MYKKMKSLLVAFMIMSLPIFISCDKDSDDSDDSVLGKYLIEKVDYIISSKVFTFEEMSKLVDDKSLVIFKSDHNKMIKDNTIELKDGNVVIMTMQVSDGNVGSNTGTWTKVDSKTYDLTTSNGEKVSATIEGDYLITSNIENGNGIKMSYKK